MKKTLSLLASFCLITTTYASDVNISDLISDEKDKKYGRIC